MSDELAVNEPMALESASVCWFTVVVTTAARSEVSATNAGLLDALEEMSQSKVTLVVPALTPAITFPTMTPVPPVMDTLHGAVLTRGDALAEAGEIEPAAKPPTNATDADATTKYFESLARSDRGARSCLFIIFICSHPYLLEEVTAHRT